MFLLEKKVSYFKFHKKILLFFPEWDQNKLVPPPSSPNTCNWVLLVISLIRPQPNKTVVVDFVYLRKFLLADYEFTTTTLSSRETKNYFLSPNSIENIKNSTSSFVSFQTRAYINKIPARSLFLKQYGTRNILYWSFCRVFICRRQNPLNCHQQTAMKRQNLNTINQG